MASIFSLIFDFDHNYYVLNDSFYHRIHVYIYLKIITCPIIRSASYINQMTAYKSAKKIVLPFLTITVIPFSFLGLQKKQTLYIIGDSTVRNSSGNGGPGQWGWGTFIASFFNSAALTVSNQAMAGRSTRTFTFGRQVG